MEDMARLALVEQSVRDVDKFSEILYEVLRHLNKILENPHDYEIRTIQSAILKKCLECEAFVDYMKYVGFQPVADTLSYPKEYSLSKLRIAQVTIERKLGFCSGPLDHSRTRTKPTRSLPQTKKTKLKPSNNILETNSPLLLKIEMLFNNMIQYEDEELQELARSQIPIVTLQLAAIDRLREHQRKLKSGEIKGSDLPFDIALLMELLGWFKYKFFSWMDKPSCKSCGKGTNVTFIGTSSMETETETCRLEIYKCTECGSKLNFPRYNDPRALLRSRVGRCGEWANCFVLLCRALGYDTRYVYDTTDHVWCEVFDYDSNRWLHVDPCEAQLNTPLMYTHGWKKKLSYVIALSKDDLQDVTWRYTIDHKEVLKRRNMCDEKELIISIMALREHRQRQVSEARQRYLAKRTLEELADLMVEKTPSDYESHGRISGSKEWRTQRGEIGTDNKSHTFECLDPGSYNIRYYPTADKYRVSCEGTEKAVITGWEAGVFERKNVFRKTEVDWHKVYLAREEGADEGAISWKLSTSGDRVFKMLSIRANTALYDDGQVHWTIKFDDTDTLSPDFKDPVTFKREFSNVVISAKLSGGLGDIAWQKAQLFRQSLESKSSAFEIATTVEQKN